MKVLHFTALDGVTGAGIAAARLHQGMRARGIQSRLCVAFPRVGLPDSFTPRMMLAGRLGRVVRDAVDGFMLGRAPPGYDYVLSAGFSGFDVDRIVAQERPDIVQLHWIGGRAFRLATLKGLQTPVVWRLSDCWAFCGLEHLQPDPGKYTKPPNRGFSWPLRFDASEHLRRHKQSIYQSIRELRIVCPSHWLAAEAARSALLRGRSIEHIPTGCDTEQFSPRPQRSCREMLGLPVDKPIVLVGASSSGTHWKGLDLFVAAMKVAADSSVRSDVHLVTFGRDQTAVEELASSVNITHVGEVKDRLMMAALYGAADVFIAPSRMETLSNAVLESLACGTPVIAFAIGGMPDMIDHKINGYLARPFETADLANGIAWAVDARDDRKIHEAARRKIVDGFSADREVDRYIDLYTRVLATTN